MGLSSAFWLPDEFKLNYGLAAWLIVTLIATGGAIYAFFLKKYQLVFDMSSGSVNVYTSNSIVDAEAAKEIIVAEIRGGSKAESQAASQSASLDENVNP